MATSENWQLFVHNGRHNHKIVVYHTVMLMLQDLRRSSCNRLSSSGKVMCRLIKKNWMQGRNMIEEVLCLSAQRGYTIFYRNREESNVLSDIVVAHPTSIAMIRTWPYVLIIDSTGNSFYVQLTSYDIQMGSSTNQALICYVCYVKWLQVWTSQVLHFGVEIMNRAESEHSVETMDINVSW
ncbi:hypothetical protein M9H77_18900 [Catharanthus roseus]|uniref:Uncharacterized protein n=1 Tax=Catharanthus roseus TaxID=4058 RepID=A0ACC0B8S5_CATRO|nr:hypothetical protein M9H77_18900 [Catharanthus roseus]